MTVPLDFLVGLASQFSAIREGPETVAAGQSVTCRVLQPSSLLTVADIVASPLNIAWISKNVRYLTENPESALNATPFQSASLQALLQGGMPARVPVVGNLVGTQELLGVPGLLNQLAGTLPIPLQVPVAVAVHWDVLDEIGTVLMESAATFQSANGLDGLEVSLAFPVQIVELTSDSVTPVVRRYIRATVTLTAGATTHSITLPKLPIVLPAIGIPTVLILFMHANFAAANGDDEGAALIIVPSNSPLRVLEQLQPVLNLLEQAIGNLTGVAEFASFLLGLQVLSNALAAQPHVQFRVADEIDNFNDITLYEGFWNDTEAEDELSSLIFVGAPGKKVQLYNDNDQDESEGWFELTIGMGGHEIQTPNLYTLIRNLSGKHPESAPTKFEIDVKKEPDGWNWMLAHSIDSFSDELSSMRFV